MTVEGQPIDMCSDLNMTLRSFSWTNMTAESAKNLTTKIFLSTEEGNIAYLMLNQKAQVIEKAVFTVELSKYPRVKSDKMARRPSRFQPLIVES